MDGEKRRKKEITKDFLIEELGRQEETIARQAYAIVRLVVALRRYLTAEEVEEIEKGRRRDE